MRLTSSCLAGLFVVSASIGGIGGPEFNPLSVIRALIDAERAFNLNAAVALFADEASIVNVTGRKAADKEELKRFVQADIWFHEGAHQSVLRTASHSLPGWHVEAVQFLLGRAAS
jgi:hypothetical protein